MLGQWVRIAFEPGANRLVVGPPRAGKRRWDEPLAPLLSAPIRCAIMVITEHDKLPDAVLYDEERNLLFLVEAVTSHGPVNPKRVEELESTLKDCTATRMYVSTFPDFRQFKQHVDKIAWETEVWPAKVPDRLIHFNGDKFPGPKADL